MWFLASPAPLPVPHLLPAYPPICTPSLSPACCGLPAPFLIAFALFPAIPPAAWQINSGAPGGITTGLDGVPAGTSSRQPQERQVQAGQKLASPPLLACCLTTRTLSLLLSSPVASPPCTLRQPDTCSLF